MGDRLARLEFNLEQLQSTVGSLKPRLDVLEAAPPAVVALAAGAASPAAFSPGMTREIS